LFFRRDLKKRTTKKSTKEIGDMGYGGEEILLGGRLFSVVNGFRLDVHEKSSIASRKYAVPGDH
jgi:hypothetical protein